MTHISDLPRDCDGLAMPTASAIKRAWMFRDSYTSIDIDGDGGVVLERREGQTWITDSLRIDAHGYAERIRFRDGKIIDREGYV